MRHLIEKAKNGDRHSIRQLLSVHRTLIESVVRRFLWNKGEIEDVLQDVFIKVVTSIATFDGKCRIDTWLYRLAVNECIDTNRRNHRLAKRFESSEMGMDIFPDLNASDGLAFTISEESSALVVSIIHTLPDAMRATCRCNA